MSSKLSSSLLIVIVSILLGLPASTVRSQSSVQKLGGSHWKARASFANSPDDLNVEFDYSFGDANKVRVNSTYVVSGFQPQSRFNMTTGRYELVREYVIMSVRTDSEVGTYLQKGRSIQLRFPSNQIYALFQDDHLVGKITMKSGEKSIWSAEIVSQSPAPTRTSDGNEKVSGGAVGLADDLGEPKETAAKLRLGVYKGPAVGTYKIGIFSPGNQSDILSISVRTVESDAVTADVALPGMAGEMSGTILDSGTLRLDGIITLKGSIVETKYQCSVTAFIQGRTLTDGKYYCQAPDCLIKGIFHAAFNDK